MVVVLAATLNLLLIPESRTSTPELLFLETRELLTQTFIKVNWLIATGLLPLPLLLELSIKD